MVERSWLAVAYDAIDLDQYQLVAGVLWLGFLLSLVAVIAGVLAQLRGRRTLALIMLFLSVMGTLAFSYAGGFPLDASPP